MIAQPYRRHRHQEFLRFLKLIDAAVPRDLELHLVLDNYATQNPRPFAWTKTADEILETLPAYCRRVSSQER